jgi:AcrR family transcriptional regulator
MTKKPAAPAYRAALAQLVHPPLRADGRRNYEALIAAADEVFMQLGPNAPLDEIARRAGVGNATLYRHFPTRRDLLIAVCVDDVQALCERGEQLVSHRSPAEALRLWLAAYIEHVSARRGLAAAFASDQGADSEIGGTCRAAVKSVAAVLLDKAQRAGVARADVSIDDLYGLVNAIAIATDGERGRSANRLLEIVVEGISPRSTPVSRPGARSRPRKHH